MRRKILVNGREVALEGVEGATVREVEPGIYSVLWNGKSFEAHISPQPGGYAVDIQAFRITTEVSDPRNSGVPLRPSQGAGRQNVTASMPGKVIRLLVSEGQEVEARQGLIVIEAMKMQNEIKSSKPGRVTHVRVHDGDTVNAGEVMITIE